MSAQKHFNPSDYQNLSIKNFKADPSTTVERLAKTVGVADDGLLVWDTDEKKLYIWNGTAWQNADKDEEILVVTDDPLVTAPTTLTAGSKLIYSSDTGFLYIVTDPIGTPVITKIGDNIVNLGTATDFDATLIDTTQFNNDGMVWLVDDDGSAILLSDGYSNFFVEWTDYNLVAGDNEFDVSGLTGTVPTITNYRTGVVAPSKSLLKNSVSVDVVDEEVVVLKEVVDTTKFIVNSDIATTATITVQFMGK